MKDKQLNYRGELTKGEIYNVGDVVTDNGHQLEMTAGGTWVVVNGQPNVIPPYELFDGDPVETVTEYKEGN